MLHKLKLLKQYTIRIRLEAIIYVGHYNDVACFLFRFKNGISFLHNLGIVSRIIQKSSNFSSKLQLGCIRYGITVQWDVLGVKGGNMIGIRDVLIKIFCVIMLIFGALLYATIFGNVTTIIQQIYAGKANV